MKTNNPHSIGIYLHIPFCSFMCHYCDFAKTANWSTSRIDSYMLALNHHLKLWIEFLKNELDYFQIHSLNIGGGTPSLITTGYVEIFKTLDPFLNADTEISLEANPNDCDKNRVNFWKNLGFNRISLGVQSFQPVGLKFLRRDHNAKKSKESINTIAKYFNNFNVDLIYSWLGQTPDDWIKDLEVVHSLSTPHLSLYNLTFAPKTPIGRAKLRGKIDELPDLQQEAFYNTARQFLSLHDYNHEEVSNWSKPGFSCKHNWLYWQNGFYLGLGAGAHGYLPFKSPVGIRYAYSINEKKFSSLSTEIIKIEKTSLLSNPEKYLIEVEKRDHQDLLLEIIGASLRSKQGFNIDHACKLCDFSFYPTPFINEAIHNKIILIDQNHQLTLHPDEWFRETTWSLEIIQCFQKKTM